MNSTGSASLPTKRRQWLITGLQALALSGLDVSIPLSWPTLLLALMAGLKLREARRLKERRLVALLQLVVTGLLAAQQTALFAGLIQLILAVGALATLLELELGVGLNWRQLLCRSLQLLTGALPLALVLFLLVPRMDPIWTLPRGLGSSARIGLGEELDPGAIAALADNNAVAARVAYSDNIPPAAATRYWRVVVQDRFDGVRWLRSKQVPSMAWSRPKQSDTERNAQRQLWLIEADDLDALPWDGDARPTDHDHRLRLNGELQAGVGATGRQTMTLISQATRAQWRDIPPSSDDLTLPTGSQPRLEALGAQWAKLPDPIQRLNAAERWFKNQPFTYTRKPGRLPTQRGLDVFLFEQQQGFCGHYASAFTALMRAAGVPARVISGFHGGEWIDVWGGAPYLEIRQDDAHAWSEVWLPTYGWVGVDPSRWVRGSVREETIERDHHALNWLAWGKRQWWSMDLSWSRWWLGFDRGHQETLLAALLGRQRGWLEALIFVALLINLSFAALILQRCQQRTEKERKQEVQRQLTLCLRELERLGLSPLPGESLDAFTTRCSIKVPGLEECMAKLNKSYQDARYGLSPSKTTQKLQVQTMEGCLRSLRRQRHGA